MRHHALLSKAVVVTSLLALGINAAPALAAWKAAIDANVEMVGGNYAAGASVRPEDKAVIDTMFDKVKAWIANQHRGYPIDIASLYLHDAAGRQAVYSEFF